MKKTMYTILAESRRKAIGLLMIATFALYLSVNESLAEKSKAVENASRIERWEQTIRNFEALDTKAPPHNGAVLLVGGSNARRWTEVDDYFPQFRIINRGFGGARLTEILHFVDRIVLPYAPKIVLVNAGGNDLSSGSSPPQIRDTAKGFIAAVHANLPDSKIYFIGLPYVKRAYGNPEAQAVINDFNKQLSALAEKEAKVGFIDLVSAFLDDKGEFQPDLFVEDGTHFSSKGYAVVAELIRAKVFPSSGHFRSAYQRGG